LRYTGVKFSQRYWFSPLVLCVQRLLLADTLSSKGLSKNNKACLRVCLLAFYILLQWQLSKYKNKTLNSGNDISKVEVYDQD